MPADVAGSVPLRVLIVEDAADDAELIALELRRSGFDAVLERVATPEAVREALARGSFDLVISDYALPGWSGVEALRLVIPR